VAKDKKSSDRKFSVDYYLSTTKHPEEIKKMMKDLFIGRCYTLERWKEIDNNTNNRRCK
jgi:hypothetical protein